MEPSGGKILIVDDEYNLLRLLSARLRAQGYEVDTAEDGETALDKIWEGPPAILLLDIGLPKLDGFEVARILKSNPLTKDIPIVVLSAKTQESDILKGRELGVESYLIKPFDPQVLLDEIRRVLEMKSK